MIPQAYITAWRSIAPWQDDAQVEQDLVLTRALVDLFAEPRLNERVVLRLGTALHKLVLKRADRYSEDIDLVQSEAGPIGEIIDDVRRILDPWLGKPMRALKEGNVTLTYRFESETPPVRRLRLKIEINTREHFSLFPLRRQELSLVSSWVPGRAEIVTYDTDELMGTKLRALYQRKKGRDLFDLWLCQTLSLVDPARVVLCFAEYVKREGHSVSRAQFEQNLHEKEQDPAFMNEIAPLLRHDTEYDAHEAMRVVNESFIARIDGESWRSKPSL